jgi:ABC-type branched-subunit amino acid transport system substrate-binding protein
MPKKSKSGRPAPILVPAGLKLNGPLWEIVREAFKRYGLNPNDLPIGARCCGAFHAVKVGFRIVYDRDYPPNTVDFTPIVRGIQASNPDFVYISSSPTETVGIVRAANEIGLKTKLFGGGMVGLQYAAIKTQLGELLNKIVDYDFYVPEPTVPFKGIESFLRYQAKAPSLPTTLRSSTCVDQVVAAR